MQLDNLLYLPMWSIHTGKDTPHIFDDHTAHRLMVPALFALLGVDLTQIHGLGPYVALKLVSECGTDMTKWPSAKHFTSWLCLAPGNKISGGKVLSSRTRRSSNRAASLLRLAATAVGRTDTALGAFYRRQRPAPGPRQPHQTPARALDNTERERVLDVLASSRFLDRSPGEVVATLLDEGRYLCSERTMYRLLAAEQPVRERRNQLRHPHYAKPELLATAPNQVWSWDITRLLGPKRWTYFYLYVLLAVLGVTRSLGRPQVSDDNPFSEAQFKTLKYHPGFPGRFDDIHAAVAFCRTFFPWYNHEHRHAGIAMLTPTRRPSRPRPADPRTTPTHSARRLGTQPGTLRSWPSETPGSPESRLDQSADRGKNLAGCSLNHEQRCLNVVDRFRFRVPSACSRYVAN